MKDKAAQKELFCFRRISALFLLQATVFLRSNPAGHIPVKRLPRGGLRPCTYGLFPKFLEEADGQNGAFLHKSGRCWKFLFSWHHVQEGRASGHGASNASLPISKLAGPSTPQMLGSPSVTEFIAKKMLERMDKNLEHEIDAFLKGYRR